MSEADLSFESTHTRTSIGQVFGSLTNFCFGIGLCGPHFPWCLFPVVGSGLEILNNQHNEHSRGSNNKRARFPRKHRATVKVAITASNQ